METAADDAMIEGGPDDEIVSLREWGSDRVYALPATPAEALIAGTAESCALRLHDPGGRVSRRHASLSWDHGRWTIGDLHSTNGLRQDGALRIAFSLTPGVEIGIGGITLIAQSARFIALRGVIARLIGWSAERRHDVDLALRAIRMAVTGRASLLLCGDGDLVSIARLLHRHGLGETRPFVVCDPRRRRTDPNARTAANYRAGLRALTAAAGGTLCVWHNRQPDDFAEVIAALREPSSRVQLVVCTHALHHGEPLIASPIVFPPLAQRQGELDRIIDEYAAEAGAQLAAASSFLPADRAWIRRYEAATLPQIEKATRRLIAIRSAGGSITRASSQLGMSHAALSEWVARRSLPEPGDRGEPSDGRQIATDRFDAKRADAASCSNVQTGHERGRRTA